MRWSMPWSYPPPPSPRAHALNARMVPYICVTKNAGENQRLVHKRNMSARAKRAAAGSGSGGGGGTSSSTLGGSGYGGSSSGLDNGGRGGGSGGVNPGLPPEFPTDTPGLARRATLGTPSGIGIMRSRSGGSSGDVGGGGGSGNGFARTKSLQVKTGGKGRSGRGGLQ